VKKKAVINLYPARKLFEKTFERKKPMGNKVEIIGMRFNKQSELNLYKADGSLKGSFKWPILKGKMEDKSIKMVLDGLCEGELKGTIVIVYRQNDDGFMEYCLEKEGKAKGQFGLSPEEAAAEAQTGDDDDKVAGKIEKAAAEN
jgi:hypothetical protein